MVWDNFVEGSREALGWNNLWISTLTPFSPSPLLLENWYYILVKNVLWNKTKLTRKFFQLFVIYLYFFMVNDYLVVSAIFLSSGIIETIFLNCQWSWLFSKTFVSGHFFLKAIFVKRNVKVELLHVLHFLRIYYSSAVWCCFNLNLYVTRKIGRFFKRFNFGVFTYFWTFFSLCCWCVSFLKKWFCLPIPNTNISLYFWIFKCRF